MTDADAVSISERAIKMLDQVPTLGQALGCVDCAKLFRKGAVCPYCGSTSIFNLAAYLGVDK
jgi:rRNA maturation endonuclease Nob1